MADDEPRIRAGALLILSSPITGTYFTPILGILPSESTCKCDKFESRLQLCIRHNMTQVAFECSILTMVIQNGTPVHDFSFSLEIQGMWVLSSPRGVPTWHNTHVFCV